MSAAKERVLKTYGKTSHQIQLEVAMSIYIEGMAASNYSTEEIAKMAWKAAAVFVRMLEETTEP